ncbi:hypothetical protein HZS_6094 [Henneguya salminicola]|nr:hypothetical protein HZS_6094 [Henneguya salminicola]
MNEKFKGSNIFKLFFYFTFNYNQIQDYSNVFINILHHKNINLLGINYFEIPQFPNQFKKIVDKNTLYSNFYLSQIFDQLSILSSYVKQFILLIEPHFHNLDDIFIANIIQAIQKYDNYKEKIEKDKMLPLFIQLSNFCIPMNDPNYLCKIWNFWRISQISALIKSSFYALKMDDIFNLFIKLIHSGDKIIDNSIYKNFNTTLKDYSFINNYNDNDNGTISYSGISLKLSSSNITIDNKILKFSYHHGFVFTHCSYRKCHLQIKFHIQTYISKIYIRWGSNYYYEELLDYQYFITIDEEINFHSSTCDNVFTIQRYVKSIILEIKDKAQKQNIYLNELIFNFLKTQLILERLNNRLFASH